MAWSKEGLGLELGDKEGFSLERTKSLDTFWVVLSVLHSTIDVTFLR